MSDTLLSNSSSDSPIKLIIRAADKRFLRRARTRVQWLCASTAPLPGQPDAVIEAFRASDGRFLLRFDDPGWNRALEVAGDGDDGSHQALWANGPAIPSDPAERETLAKGYRFAFESAGDFGDHAFRIRAANGKLCVPRESGEAPGHLEANGNDGDRNSVFYVSLLF
jgi:hypothetical protein